MSVRMGLRALVGPVRSQDHGHEVFCQPWRWRFARWRSALLSSRTGVVPWSGTSDFQLLCDWDGCGASLRQELTAPATDVPSLGLLATSCPHDNNGLVVVRMRVAHAGSG